MIDRSVLLLAAIIIAVVDFAVDLSPAKADQKKPCELSDPVIARSQTAACPTPADSQVLPDELILPMPCGQAMVFRKVVVPGAHALDQQEIFLGGASTEDMNSEILSLTLSARAMPIAGSFAHGEGTRDTAGSSDLSAIKDKSYYIGKYEVLVHQFLLMNLDAFSDPAGKTGCENYFGKIEKMTAKRVRPVSEISWFDAIQFSRAYSAWLIQKGADDIAAGGQPTLPWEHGTTSYVRLPTEVEWEYAARGGVARSQDIALQGYRIRDPQSGDIRQATMDEIAVTATRSSRGGQLRPPGTRPANVFGIYDMVGNVDEIVLDSFRAVRPDALYAQTGGYIVKGGNIQTNPALIGVGYRREVPYFTANGETRAATTGFRLAVATPVFISGKLNSASWQGGSANPAFIEALSNARQNLRASAGTHRENLQASLNELKERLANETIEQEELLGRVNSLQSELDRSNAELNESAQKTLYERFRSSVFMARNINQLGGTILLIESQIPKLEAAIANQENSNVRRKLTTQLDQGRARIREREVGIRASFGVYVDQLIETSKADPEALTEAARMLDQEFERTGLQGFRRYIEIANRHLAVVMNTGAPPSGQQIDAWLFEVDEKRKSRSVSR